MNRQEFLRQLESLLMNIPEQERADAMAYYNDYFDEAGVENEQNVIKELGSPQRVAQSIIDDVRNSGYSEPRDYEEKRKFKTWQIVLIVLLLIVTFPVWIGLVAGLFGGLIGILGGLFGILVGIVATGLGLTIGGIAIFGAGIMTAMVVPVEGVTCMGVGLLLTSIGILFSLLFVLLTFVWIPKLVKAIVGWIKGLFHRNEGGNEI